MDTEMNEVCGVEPECGWEAKAVAQTWMLPA